MSRRKLSEGNLRKLTRVGGTSLSVTIPMEYVRLLKWKERQKVVVRLEGKKLIVKDWPGSRNSISRRRRQRA